MHRSQDDDDKLRRNNTIILEIVLVFMHQLAQLKQVIELSATEGYIFGITFHKKSIQIHHIPVLKKL